MPPVKRQKRPRKTPTFKEKKFAKKYIELNGNGSQAAQATYDVKKEHAPNLANQLLHKPIVQQTIQKILDKSGLSLDTLSDYSQKAIEINMQHGKPSMASAVSMIQFMYKLHNAVPAKQSMHVSVSRSERLTIKSYDETKKSLEAQAKASERLLEDLK